MKTTGVECSLKARIPEGVYAGYWGGYDVVVNHDGEQWNIRTKDGIRGVNMPVSVVVDENVTSIVQVKEMAHALSMVDVTLEK